jgi:hypothetical protein
VVLIRGGANLKNIGMDDRGQTARSALRPPGEDLFR